MRVPVLVFGVEGGLSGTASADFLSAEASHSGPSAIHGSRTSVTPRKPSLNPKHKNPVLPKPPQPKNLSPKRAQQSDTPHRRSPRRLVLPLRLYGSWVQGCVGLLWGRWRRFWSHGWRKNRSPRCVATGSRGAPSPRADQHTPTPKNINTIKEEKKWARLTTHTPKGTYRCYFPVLAELVLQCHTGPGPSCQSDNWLGPSRQKAPAMLVEMSGIEPLTSSLRTKRSPN